MLRPPLRICFSFLALILSLSCRPAVDWGRGLFFVLTSEGELRRVEDWKALGAAARVPWPRQVRVTDILADGKRFFLAVNGHGLAEVTVTDEAVSVRSRYDLKYFGGRTVTRLFPFQNDLYCHVYFDASFSEDQAPPAPGGRLALLRFSPDSPAAGFAPVRMTLPPPAEPWEAVMGRALDTETLAFEWKRTAADRAEFRYSTLDLASGAETEKTRSWYYDAARPEGLSAPNIDPGLRRLLENVAGALEREAAGCVVLFACRDARSSLERRYLYPDPGGKKKGRLVYYSVPVTAAGNGWLALLPDCRFINAPTGEEKDWYYGLLPALPDGFQYTGLAECGGYLCFSWEEVDFYRVGRAGIFLKEERVPRARRRGLMSGAPVARRTRPRGAGGKVWWHFAGPCGIISSDDESQIPVPAPPPGTAGRVADLVHRR